MGHGLTYRLTQGDPEKANRWIQNQEESNTLDDYGYTVRFWTEVDENDPESPNHMSHDIRDGYNNLGINLSSNATHILEAWTTLFEKMHEHDDFKIEIYAGSCSLRIEDGYFTGDQLERLTDNGTALTGESEQIQEITSQFKESQ